MAESEGVQAIANKAAIQDATGVIMVLREPDTGPKSGMSTASPRKYIKT